ncbi:MAG TPA: LysM peptidoglycan-binding domain-containing protein [Herpetosiphonaceae bacterium]
MDCREVRRLLNQGVTPSSYDALRATMGFHLAMCSDCRTYRVKQAYRRCKDQQLLAALLSQQPPIRSQQVFAANRFARRTPRRQSHRGLHAAGVRVLLGSLLALSPLGGSAAPAPSPAPQPASAPVQTNDDAILVERQQYRAPERAAIGAAAASQEQSAPPSIEPGQTLLIPAVQDAPSADRAQQTGATVYTVQSGDTLTGIAWRFYGNANLWTTIYDANRNVIGANPHMIYPGQRIVIQSMSTPAPAPVPPQSGEVQGLHTVRSGESLWSIAQQAYGNGTGWNTIYQANQHQIANPSMIFPGQELTIPRQLSHDPGAIVDGSGSYTVQPGDSLWSIAQRYYGDGTQYWRIYQANQGQIANPILIYPGMTLTIP